MALDIEKSRAGKGYTKSKQMDLSDRAIQKQRLSYPGGLCASHSPWAPLTNSAQCENGVETVAGMHSLMEGLPYLGNYLLCLF